MPRVVVAAQRTSSDGTGCGDIRSRTTQGTFEGSRGIEPLTFSDKVRRCSSSASSEYDSAPFTAAEIVLQTGGESPWVQCFCFGMCLHEYHPAGSAGSAGSRRTCDERSM